jgi:hypothetical protein
VQGESRVAIHPGAMVRVIVTANMLRHDEHQRES